MPQFHPAISFSKSGVWVCLDLSFEPQKSKRSCVEDRLMFSELLHKARLVKPKNAAGATCFLQICYLYLQSALWHKCSYFSSLFSSFSTVLTTKRWDKPTKRQRDVEKRHSKHYEEDVWKEALCCWNIWC